MNFNAMGQNITRIQLNHFLKNRRIPEFGQRDCEAMNYKMSFMSFFYFSLQHYGEHVWRKMRKIK